jgi:hypothetical protein
MMEGKSLLSKEAKQSLRAATAVPLSSDVQKTSLSDSDSHGMKHPAKQKLSVHACSRQELWMPS